MVAIPSFRKSNLLNLLLRTGQLIIGLSIIGLYGVDLNRAHREDKYTDGKWVFAVVCGTLAAVTAITYGIVGAFLSYNRVALLFAWDFVLMILFAALSGIFGSMFMHEAVEMEWGIHRMKVAVGFDLAGLVLWFITGCLGLWWTLAERRGAGKVSPRGKA
ncbi:hypothetical protein LTR10_016148 [Elasticomyces elasticus]|uniref:MARVEL domain-containing protein n=1 Tax=Exophiala sideris TaxID=1016849 RepID=A0ABR0JEJ2_9EURO|nr:hypothetical protein LTR10_016148 [Elasticomyces elasticus]KAK5027594.1 hypothetical protein LTR13_009527 [Exophiala sideris]KAK5032843.1 hypothetical protein LTS07_004253 [Exophiala sideris]KAK5062367.1 hypothetical protein LTR69_004725 [Exophiala sideris]KAK5177525.1 hypothetical protein LTR44_009935 [Eurotiomycetes sp. CCFEE 6388]